MVGLPLSMAFFSPKEVAPATQKAIGMSNKSDLGGAVQLETCSVTVPPFQQPFYNRSTTVPRNHSSSRFSNRSSSQYINRSSNRSRTLQ